MFQVLSSDWSTAKWVAELMVPIVWSESYYRVIRCLRGGKINNCVHLANNTKDCVPLPINHLVTDGQSVSCPQSPFLTTKSGRFAFFFFFRRDPENSALSWQEFQTLFRIRQSTSDPLASLLVLDRREELMFVLGPRREATTR
jgi:hypothetical protein